MAASPVTAAARRGLRVRAPDGWTALTILVALLVAGPLVGLPVSFVTGRGDALSRFSGLLPEALLSTLGLVVGVGLGTLLLGTGLAALTSFCEFPGRSWLEWALVLPLAVPGYVFTLFALGTLPAGGAAIRSLPGAVAVFTLVLYPYVYLLARAAFLSQSGALFEAARGLGLSRLEAIVRVGLPLARPAILGGVALALMEALADFGTVNLLGVHTFTDAIYKVWFIAFDREAAMQLATFLVSITLLLLALERLARGRARYGAPGRSLAPIRLRGPAATAALGLPLALLAVVVAAPLGQLAAWAVASIRDGLLAPEFATAARNSVMLAVMSALLVGGVATLLAYGSRASRSRRRLAPAAAVRAATIGYGLPGSVVAVAVIAPLRWLDGRIDDAFGSVLGIDPGLVLTGTVIGLFCAYTVRFLALAFQAVDASLGRIPADLDEAARGLGSDRLDVLARVHVPLIRTGLLSAALLVFTEVMKELPATMLLRPLGGDTLAIEVWQATSESLFKTAALPALLIVLVGLVPVILMIRLSGRRYSEPQAAVTAGRWSG